MAAGKYERQREIGRGGMGTVWLAHDSVLGRSVAMKRVGLVPGGASPNLERAEREARLAAALNHPHVVAVFDLVAEGDGHWLVMEYVEGASLAERIRLDGPLAPDAASTVLVQVAEALAAAHASGIVHRDVKPSNILVTDDGHAKLTDFGIARAEADASLTQTGLVTGSPAYLAPEVASGASATPASDVWAFGATLFHTLAGRPPYDVGENVLGALYKIVHEAPPRLEHAGWLAPLLEHTMATDPADRWTAVEVRDFLRERRTPVSQSAPVQASSTSLPPGAGSAPARTEQTTAFAPLRSRSVQPKTPLWQSGAASVAVLALLAGGLWLGLRDTEEDDGKSSSADSSPAPSAEPVAPSNPETSVATEPSATAMEGFVTGYLDTVTSDPRATWQQLTPQFQEKSGSFGRYNSFWRSIEDITLLDISADPAQRTVTYTVRYSLRRGGESTDNVTLHLEPDADGFQVADES